LRCFTAKFQTEIVCITHRKDNVLELWDYLLQLLAKRRTRLELNHNLQLMFQEMISLLDWQDDVQVGGKLSVIQLHTREK